MIVAGLLACVACAGSSATPKAVPASETTPISPEATALPVVWHPASNTSWQWQLQGQPIDTSVRVDMYDIDLFDNTADVVAALHDQGRKVVCYVNAGGWEDWRSDAGQFPPDVLGKNLDGWEGEKWLDIRELDALGPILRSRMDLCRDKGFDGIEPDNVDGYTNDTGFLLTYEDQVTFNRWLAVGAHERGLSIGLKNDMDQIPDLLDDFDWALNEQCFQFDECETLAPFIEAGKPVFNVEYELEPDEFCDEAVAMGFNSLKKNWDLDAWRHAC
jgi:hypothetical protein